MVLLRRVIGDALRSRRQGQHRTLREVSTAANVSLGYLSEIERGQKEASSELLAAICDALGAQLSELLRDVSDTVALAEAVDGVVAPVGAGERDARDGSARTPDKPDTPAQAPATASTRPGVSAGRAIPAVPRADRADPRRAVGRAAARRAADTVRHVATDGTVSVSVHQETPLKATLRATRTARPADREVVCAV